MSTEKSSNAYLAPEGDQGQLGQSRPLAPSTEQTLQDSRTAAQEIVSAGLKIIGPLEKSITRRSNNAIASISALTALTEHIERTSTLGDLNTTESIILQAERDLYELEVLPELITKTMILPEIAQHENRFQIYEDLTKHCEGEKVDDYGLRLSEALKELKFMLREHGIETSDFVPNTNDVFEAHKTTDEEPENTVIEMPPRQNSTAPTANFSDSFQALGLFGMISDECQTDTGTAVVTQHTEALLAEIERGRRETAERDRLHEQKALLLTEQIALSKQQTQSNHMTAVHATVRPLVQQTMTASVNNINNTANDISSKQPELPPNLYLDIMNAINNIQAQISSAGNEQDNGEREEARESKHDLRISPRAQHNTLNTRIKTAGMKETEQKSSLNSDDENSRKVSSGSEDDYDGHRRHSRHDTKATADQRQTSKQPKLATVLSLFPKFDGSGDWEEFRDTFNNDIMSRDDIRMTHKHKILSDHLTGAAECCVATSKNHSMAIEATFANLKLAFGKVHTKEKLLKKLAKLPFHQSDTEKMRQDMVTIANISMLLLEKGVSDTDDRITKVVTSKLPKTLRDSVLDDWSEKDPMTIKDIIAKASSDIFILELEEEFHELASTSAMSIPNSSSIYSASAQTSTGRKNINRANCPKKEENTVDSDDSEQNNH
ncbi:unnamed protein product [Caenorhabditis nigoni]